MKHSLPAYAHRLDAFHRALADEFRRLIGRLPLRGTETVLDAGCGDGFFTRLLADRLPLGEVVALDRSKEYLNEMEQRLESSISTGSVRPALGNVVSLPFRDRAFDVVWSAHSMQSYPAIRPVLAEFLRVLKRDGLLAVLETDNLHSLVLSWPPEIELAVRQAEHDWFGDGDGRVGAYFPRFALSLLRDARFRKIGRHYEFIERHQPIDDATEEYVRLYLGDMIDRVGTRLESSTLTLVERLASPASNAYLPRQDDFFFGSLQVLFTATMERESRQRHQNKTAMVDEKSRSDLAPFARRA